MKIALCSTSIHIPHTLHLLRKCSDSVKFFVAGDLKSPHMDIIANQAGLGEYDYLLPGAQEKWKCSAAIGWNCIQRRNIAFLEALAWGADIIVSWDTDNIPVAPDYFNQFAWGIQHNFYGVQVTGADGWFDPGSLLVPRTRARGFPHAHPRMLTADSIVNAKVGVVAGLVIGDPDVDATTRMELHPDIQSVSELAKAGVVVSLNNWTIFNSQNTSLTCGLIPAFFLMPGVGRHDDLYASLIVQRVARERGYHVHFGQPLAYQQRHSHDLLKDLRAEIDGMGNTVKLAAFLDAVILPGYSAVADTRIIYEALLCSDLVPNNAARAALLWLEDVETVL
jgi:hypothetical protein